MHMSNGPCYLDSFLEYGSQQNLKFLILLQTNTKCLRQELNCKDIKKERDVLTKVCMMQCYCTVRYSQYLNCKILHGGTLLQPWPTLQKVSGNDVFPSPKLNEDQKKSSSPQIGVSFPRNQVNRKKKSSPQFATIFGRKFVGSFSLGWLFFLWSSGAQLSMGGRSLLMGGRVPPPSPYNLILVIANYLRETSEITITRNTITRQQIIICEQQS